MDWRDAPSRPPPTRRPARTWLSSLARRNGHNDVPVLASHLWGVSTMETNDAETAAVARRFAVHRSGVPGAPRLVLVHGFGCDQSVWDGIRPLLERDFDVISYDLLGCGASDTSAYDRNRYSRLDAHVDDLLTLLRALRIDSTCVLAHSVGATIALLASLANPERFVGLALVGASARYVNDGDYVGGLAPADVDELLQLLDTNWELWSTTMAPQVMGNAERPHLADDLRGSFMRLPADIARQLGTLSFRVDIRDQVERVTTPTMLVQSDDDIVVPKVAAAWLHEHLPGSEFVQLAATGHLPHMSDPRETAAVVLPFLRRVGRITAATRSGAPRTAISRGA